MSNSNDNSKGGGLSRREFIRLSLAVSAGALAGAVAACAPAQPTQAPTAIRATSVPATSVPVATTAPTSAPTAATTKAPVSLRFWFIAQGTEFDKVMRAAVKDFEDTHPNIRIEVDTAATNDIRTRLKPIFTNGGVGPDILMEGAVQTATYAGMPYGFIDLTDRIKAADLLKKTPPAAWAPLKIKDAYFGLPFDAFPFFLAYNKDLYGVAGITKPPETWDELLDNCRKITNKAKDTWGWISFVNLFASWPLEALWYNSGVGYFEGSENFDVFDVTKPLTINTPVAVAAVEYFRKLCETAPGGIQGNFNVGTSDADVAFAKGNIAHLFTHSIHHAQYQTSNKNFVPTKNFDVALFPKGPKRQGCMFSTSVMGLTKLSRNPDAAWEWVNYFSDKWEGRIAPVIGTVPVRQDVSVDENATGSWLLKPGRAGLALPTSHPQAFFPQLDAVRDPMANNIQAYFLDKKTAQQAMDDAATEAKKTLSK